MPRGKPRNKSTSVQSSAFADALKFISLICKDTGNINETHIHIENNRITAFNGILAMGTYHDSSIDACPQIKLAVEALSKCGQNFAITQLENKLSVRADKFRATIPCIASNLLSVAIPDAPIAIVDDKLKEALSIAGELCNENSERIYSASVLLDQGSVISTLEGCLVFQYWHGFDLPPLLCIPKALCNIIGKIDKKLTKFGYSPFSVTFYFEDNSWIRTQLYAEQWPMVMHIFDTPSSNLIPFPADFWTAVAAVSPFGEGNCHFLEGRLSSHAQEGVGASFDLPGLPVGPIFPAKQLAFLKPWATHFQATEQRMLAVGKNARAVIAGVKQ